ncbi:3-isopropylmalate dehydratase [Pseudorhodoferax soli]|uniref:3-isopropylmalate dehydratase small subunit n=1 Tax=Pseudorhodoferax soli TaxID=545864 RepID=A0A368Y2P2_9BURK|nr:3-isopropylmalate dehydratase [Pseudorhodoferax soli]RCW74462.1 3-isopropylmalate dehydratase small subunit [Pseudorhodoferax soli]
MNTRFPAATGRAWVFGDDLNTDLLAPGRYMKLPLAEIAQHCLESVEPGFATGARPGDIVLAGRNFGAGSSREQAAEVLRHIGIACVVAQSFSGIFYRNAFNLGLPLLVCDQAPTVADGSPVACDLDGAMVVDHRSGRALACVPPPSHLIAMVRAGGLVPHLAQRLAAQRATLQP